MCQDHFSHISICAVVCVVLFPCSYLSSLSNHSSNPLCAGNRVHLLLVCKWLGPGYLNLPAPPLAARWADRQRVTTGELKSPAFPTVGKTVFCSVWVNQKWEQDRPLLNSKRTRAPRRPVLDVFVGKCIRGVLAHPPPTQSRPGPARQTTELLINGGAVKGSRRVINWAQDLICNVLMKWERG